MRRIESSRRCAFRGGVAYQLAVFLCSFLAFESGSYPGGVAVAQCPQVKLTASDAACGDYFGGAVDIDGDVAVMTSVQDDHVASNAGSAYVFRRSGTEWVQEQKLIASDAGLDDRFGWDVAISGWRILVGAIDATNGSSFENGAAYTFLRSGPSWVEEQRLLPSDPQFLGHFGFAVALHNGVAVVSAIREEFGGGDESGAAYVFRYNGSSWVQEQKLVGSDTAAFDYFGTSVAVHNGVIVVGARLADPDGAAYVFRYNGSAWVEEQKLTPTGGRRYFGVSVDVQDNTVAVGADDNGTAAFGPGAVFMYSWSGVTWNLAQTLVGADTVAGDAFGNSVSLKLPFVLAGAPGESASGVSAGAAYLFQLVTGWEQHSKFAADDPQDFVALGGSVELTTGAAILSASGIDDASPANQFCDSGAGYLIDLQTCLGSVPIPTLSEWGLALMAIGVILVGAIVVARREGVRRVSTGVDQERTAAMKSLFSFTLFGNLVLLSLGEIVAAQPLRPRTPPFKAATVVKPQEESILQVKFRDDLKVRSEQGELHSKNQHNMGRVRSIQARFGLTFVPMVRLPESVIASFEERAAQNSGNAQPDFGGMMRVLGPDEVLQEAAEELLALEEIERVSFRLRHVPPPCSDVTPTTTQNYFANGNQDYFGDNPGLNNMACAWTFGGKGGGIDVADVESGLIADHEDLRDVYTSNPASCLFQEASHGAASLGVLVSLENNYGCTGLVPQAGARFYSVYTDELSCPNHGGRVGAIVAAAADLAAGDVLLLELQEQVPDALGPGPAELDHDVWDATKSASDAGIIVVAAAGNGDED